MSDGHAFGRPHEKDRVVKFFAKKPQMTAVVHQAQYFHETKDWYARHVPRCDLKGVLEMAGLWSADLGKDWMAANLAKNDLFDALVEFDMIGGCTVDWIEANVGKRNMAKALNWSL